MPFQEIGGAVGEDKKVMVFTGKQKPTLQGFGGMLSVSWVRVHPELSTDCPLVHWDLTRWPSDFVVFIVYVCNP